MLAASRSAKTSESLIRNQHTRSWIEDPCTKQACWKAADIPDSSLRVKFNLQDKQLPGQQNRDWVNMIKIVSDLQLSQQHAGHPQKVKHFDRTLSTTMMNILSLTMDE
jgi:hypothetical protein